MSKHVSGENIADTWIAALEAVHLAGNEIVNFTATVANPSLEQVGTRRALDQFVASLAADGAAEFSNPKSIHTVANTIFPVSLYRQGRAEKFYASALEGQRGRHGDITSWGAKGGTYAGRLLRYPTYDRGEFNQLRRMLKNLDATTNYQDSYEMAVACEAPDEGTDSPDLFSTSASTFVPAYDNVHRGGQCLSHISLTLSNKRLSMSALYRHQTFISRAYGNFLGLSRVLHFLVRESGKDLQVGELMIVASHASIEQSARSSVGSLLDRLKGVDEPTTEIEWQARRLGQSWRDLDLPSVEAAAQ